MASTSAGSHETSSANWSQLVSELYPDALSRTYSVPPVHFNRVPFVRETVPGTGLTPLVPNPPAPTVPPVPNAPPAPPRLIGPQPPPPPQALWPAECHWCPHVRPGRVQDTDLQDDAAQAHVLRHLEALGTHRQEVMFILSQVNFNNYLNKPAYAAAVAQLPRPSQLNTAVQSFSDGDFDVLVIHRHRDVLVGELKTVGKNQAQRNLSEADADKEVAKTLGKAVRQLDKSEAVIQHLVSDIAPRLTVRKTLILPYVSSTQLGRVLANNPPLEQALMTSLGANTSSDAVDLCCTSDRMSSPQSTMNISAAVMQKLERWWTLIMNITDPSMTDKLYLDIVARFVGPATTVRVHCSSTPRVTVEVRTEGQAVAQLGLMLASLVLTRPQIDLLTWSPQLVYISGPPGTGKTVVLVVQGMKWLRQQNDVHVVSTRTANRAVCLMICQQLQRSLSSDSSAPQAPGRVVWHDFNFLSSGSDAAVVEPAVGDLVAAAVGGVVHVVVDEVDFGASSVHGRRCQHLVTDLAAQLPGLHLWCAGTWNDNTPSVLQSVSLTQPLRCAPVVLREVQQGVDRMRSVDHYTGSGVPAPGDGLRVTRLVHQGGAHTGRWPVDCPECGQNVATELRRLGVGIDGSGLSYRDVLVVTRSGELHDEVTNDTGVVTSPASGVVQGLRGAGLPVCVVGGRQDVRRDRAGWLRNHEDMAVARSDAVTAAYFIAVLGLERRVVVYLPGRIPSDEGLSDDDIQAADRLQAMSRCTTHLVVIAVPAPRSRWGRCAVS